MSTPHSTTSSPEFERAADVLRLSAFASEAGGGNPAGVVLDASTLSDTEMQSIAAEIGYAETAFVVDPSVDANERHVRVRYFSPGAEVPFCGHATIATAVALAERRGPGQFTIETLVGPVVIETSRADAQSASPGDASADASPVTASFTSVETDVRELAPPVADRLLSLLHLDPSDLDGDWPLREAFAGNWHPIVAVREQATFDAFSFDPAAVRALMDEQGWAGTVTVVCRQQPTASGSLVVEARNLFPVGTITEDPATGSAAASLGAYLRQVGAITPKARFTVLQGRHVGRPSLITVDVPVTGGITVTGTATPIE